MVFGNLNEYNDENTSAVRANMDVNIIIISLLVLMYRRVLFSVQSGVLFEPITLEGELAVIVGHRGRSCYCVTVFQ